MPDLMTRPNHTGRPALSEWFGYDPLRAFFGPSGFGAIDVQRTEGGYSVEIPAPGYKPDHIDVTVENGVLTVRAKNEKRSFSRTLLLPDEIDAENIAANVEHGMLTLTLAMHPKAQPRKIEVRSQG